MANEAQDLSFAIDGARLANSMPYIEAELEKAMAAVVTRVDQDFANNRLNPEIALVAWIELLSYRRLQRRLNQQIKIGITAATRQKDILSPNLPLPR